MSSKVVRSEGLGWKREYNMWGKNTRNYAQYFLIFVFFTICTYCILRRSCVYC